VNWTQNNEFVVKANPHYWQPGIPYLDGITFKPIVADATRENTLRSGGVDLMVTRDPTAIVDLGSDSQYQQVSALDQKIGEPDMDFIVLNTTVAPLSDLTVRQGLAYSLDVVTLGKLFGGGISKPSTSLFQEGSPYYAPNGYPEFDLTKGKALISQAKANHGGSISFSLETIPDPKLEAAVQAIQQMWNQAGCDVTIGTIQQVDLIQNMATGINFQAYTSEQFGAFDPDLNYVWWDSSSAKGPIALNFARNQDPQIDAALTLGRTSADPATRIKAYQTVDQRLAADLPYLWLRIAPWSMTASTKVQNFANAGLPDGSHGFPFNGGVFNPTAIWLQG
jgi:peptide/nickel transport system substrate-binding protein